MGKVNPNEYGSSRPKLEPDDLEGDAAVLTVAEFKTENIEDPERSSGVRPLAMLLFEETADKALFLNKTQIEYLIEGLGSDNSDRWIGKRVVVEKVKKEYMKTTYEKVWIMDSEEWDQYLSPTGTRRRKVAKKAANRGKRK